MNLLAINRQLTPTLNPVKPSSCQLGDCSTGLSSCVAFAFFSSPLWPEAARKGSNSGR